MPYAQCPIPDRIATEILSIYDSPLYVYQGDILSQTIDRITKSIPYPHTKFYFASVTKGNISLLQIFKNCGWGIHANTPGDVFLALKAGFSPENIVYSGSNLSNEEMASLLNWGITTFNLDSVAQLRVFCDVYQSRNNQNICSALTFTRSVRLSVSARTCILLAREDNLPKEDNLVKEDNLPKKDNQNNNICSALTFTRSVRLSVSARTYILLAREDNLPKEDNLVKEDNLPKKDNQNNNICSALTHYKQKNQNRQEKIKLGLRLNLAEITGESRIGVRPNEFL